MQFRHGRGFLFVHRQRLFARRLIHRQVSRAEERFVLGAIDLFFQLLPQRFHRRQIHDLHIGKGHGNRTHFILNGSIRRRNGDDAFHFGPVDQSAAIGARTAQVDGDQSRAVGHGQGFGGEIPTDIVFGVAFAIGVVRAVLRI